MALSLAASSERVMSQPRRGTPRRLLNHAHPNNARRLGPTQLGPTQLGPTQLGPTQLGPTQLGPTQLGPTQLGRTAATACLPSGRIGGQGLASLQQRLQAGQDCRPAFADASEHLAVR